MFLQITCPTTSVVTKCTLKIFHSFMNNWYRVRQCNCHHLIDCILGVWLWGHENFTLWVLEFHMKNYDLKFTNTWYLVNVVYLTKICRILMNSSEFKIGRLLFKLPQKILTTKIDHVKSKSCIDAPCICSFNVDKYVKLALHLSQRWFFWPLNKMGLFFVFENLHANFETTCWFSNAIGNIFASKLHRIATISKITPFSSNKLFGMDYIQNIQKLLRNL